MVQKHVMKSLRSKLPSSLPMFTSLSSYAPLYLLNPLNYHTKQIPKFST